MAADTLLVRGRRLAPDGTLRAAAFAVVEGRVAPPARAGQGARVLDFGDRLVVPGAVDPHVHFRDPGHPQKEDFASGTRGAAIGGVTTVLDMPNTVPPVFTAEALASKRAGAEARAAVDFGLYAGLDERGEALEIFPAATAVKVYLGATTGHLLVQDEGLIRRALAAAADAGRTVVFHAESQECLERHAHLAGADYPSHARSRPPQCEAEAIHMVARAARGIPGARVHIAHLSTRKGLEALSGTGFTAEACPHHLLLEETRLAEGGRFKMNPPLRSKDDVGALWEGLRSGRIPCLASDHAPHTPEEKGEDRMVACPAGVPGVETLLPVLLPHARAGRIPLPRLLDAATAAARIFRLPGKGRLDVGFDADFAVYDLDQEVPVRGERLQSRAGWSPFEGMPAVFPTHVFLRGEPVVEEGRFVGRPGGGRFVLPA